LLSLLVYHSYVTVTVLDELNEQTNKQTNNKQMSSLIKFHTVVWGPEGHPAYKIY